MYSMKYENISRLTYLLRAGLDAVVCCCFEQRLNGTASKYEPQYQAVIWCYDKSNVNLIFKKNRIPVFLLATH